MTIVIKNALVYDGSGKPPVKGDVLIKDEQIAGIGNFSHRQADKVIDALGAMVTPGFIDVNTDSDHYLSLFSDPEQGDFIRQGVTTIIGGNCGASLAPVLSGSLRSIRKWADVNEINLDWHTTKEFLEALARQKLGINFGTLVGHATVRRTLVGEEVRNLTEKEIESFKAILKTALKEGAFGLSTGLGYIHARTVPYNEIKALVEIVAKYKKVYATHLRNEGEGLLESINETVSLAKDTGANVEISHFRPLIGSKGDYDQALGILDANAASAHVHFDLYPFETSIVPIYTLLPGWAQGSLESMLDRLTNQETKEKIAGELLIPKAEDFLIAKAPSAFKFLVGKTLKDFADNRALKAKDALIELMDITNLGVVFFQKNINVDAAMKALTNPRALVASNGAALPAGAFKHERFYNTFPKFLQLVAEKNLMPAELAIEKMTSLPAKKYGIKDRGVIAHGYRADLVIVRDSKPSEVIVNGIITMEAGQLQHTLGGQILKS